MPSIWIIIAFVILATVLYTLISMRVEGSRQKRLLQIQADKRHEQVNKYLMLVLPMGDFNLLITPNLSAGEDNYQTIATLGWNGSDLSERVSRFPHVAVFKKIILSGKSNSEWNREESQARNKYEEFLTGNKEFDKFFSIYAKSKSDVYQILTNEIQQGLLKLVSKSPRLRTDEMQFFATAKMIRDTATYDSFIDTAISISEQLTGTTYEPKLTTDYVVTRSDTASENVNLSPVNNEKENIMSFFKNLFGKGESEGEAFVPTPTQSIPGVEPIVVQAIENLFPNTEDQKKAFSYALEYKGSQIQYNT